MSSMYHPSWGQGDNYNPHAPTDNTLPKPQPQKKPKPKPKPDPEPTEEEKNAALEARKRRIWGTNPELNKKLHARFGNKIVGFGPNSRGGGFGEGQWEYTYNHVLNDAERAEADRIYNAHHQQGAETTTAANISNPTLPNGSTFNPVAEQADEQHMLDRNRFRVNPTGVQATYTAAQAPNAKAAQTYDPSLIGNNVPQGEAAQGQVSDNAQVDAATREGAYDEYTAAIEQARMEAEQFELDKRATVQEQYKQLMDFGADEIPDWAKGSIRQAEATMAARGLGASTMAGEAINAATMRAALPIAQQDAKAFLTMSMDKFGKRQQATLMKAAHLANLDLSSLNNQQQAAVENARAFLAMDMSNLNNRQQMAIMNTQSRVQAMLSDQAAENAALQFNAKSENDMRMFYDNLRTQVETFNAAQKNEISRFNAEIINQRQQFNKKNALLIEQSNVEYLRGISTRNTQMQNQANYVNSQNLLEISNTAIANHFQLLRDREAFAFEMVENAQDRALTRWMTAAQLKQNADFAETDMWMSIGNSVGNFAGRVLGGVLD